MKTQPDKIQEPQTPITPKVTSEPSSGGTAQLMDNRTSTINQRKLQKTMNGSAQGNINPIQRKVNKTGLPDNLKSGIENLSGYSMEDVKVHYNSSKPAQLQAHAYAQGTDIHLASGQEKHLPHEAWHVVQQKQGRVKPTKQLKSKVNINDDSGLEKEADVMGAKALEKKTIVPKNELTNVPHQRGNNLVQRQIDDPEELRGQKTNTDIPIWIRTEIKKVLSLVGFINDQGTFDHINRWLVKQKNKILRRDANKYEEGLLTKLLMKLQHLQFLMEYWRDNLNNAQWGIIKDTWKDTHKSVVDFLYYCTVERNNMDPANSGTTLAKKFEPALISLAMRITVTNSSHVTSTTFAQDRNTDHAAQQGHQHTALAPNLGTDTPESLRRKLDKLDEKGQGICSEFAAAAASILEGNGVSVEIMGTSQGDHNFVVLGRLPTTDPTKPKTWNDENNDNTRIIDCWWGAMKWNGYDEYPNVIWEPGAHEDMGNKPDAILYPPQNNAQDPLKAMIAKLAASREERNFNLL